MEADYFEFKHEPVEEWNPYSLIQAGRYYLTIASGFISILAFITAGLRRMFIPKYRNFRTFVITNLTLSSVLHFILKINLDHHNEIEELSSMLNMYNLPFRLMVWTLTVLEIYNCWLFIMCLIFYRDIVTKIRGNWRRNYVFMSLFAWVIPIVLKMDRSSDLKSNTIDKNNFEKLMIGSGLFEEMLLSKILTVIHVLVFLNVVCYIARSANTTFIKLKCLAKVALTFLMGSGIVVALGWILKADNVADMYQKYNVKIQITHALIAIHMILTNMACVVMK